MDVTALMRDGAVVRALAWVEAHAGQILVSQRVYGKVEERLEAEHVGEMTLKGLTKPVPAYNVIALRG